MVIVGHNGDSVAWDFNFATISVDDRPFKSVGEWRGNISCNKTNEYYKDKHPDTKFCL